jgi:EAL domain-containing protein (putative c-di-GMP-specific phosphodiesterase class I)
MKKALERNINLANKIDLAIENNAIDIAFQKVIDSRDNSVLFIEALTRWTDAELGYVLPTRCFLTRSNPT